MKTTMVPLPANPAGVLCEFSDLPAGTYAISVFHDENDDGVLNSNFVGMPREGYGFSNNYTYAMHPASFEESHFTVDDQGTAELHTRLLRVLP
jgi:uncharacterized protein (DUF2141 family)